MLEFTRTTAKSYLPNGNFNQRIQRSIADIIDNDQPGVRQIRRTYAEIWSEADGWKTEARDGRAWRDANFSAERVAERRAAIQARGRQQ